MLKALAYLFYLELLLHLRRPQEWLYPLTFFLITMSLFPLAFTPDAFFLQKYFPGCIWIAALLASLLSSEYIFLTDIEEGFLEQLILSGLPLPLLVLTKVYVQWLLTQLPLIILTPLLGLLFHVSFAAITILCITLFLGTPILTLIGSLGVALTLGLHQQGVLLSLIIFPLLTPVLIFGVNIVVQSEAGFTVLGPLAFLAGLTLLAIHLVPWAMAEALRISLDD